MRKNNHYELRKNVLRELADGFSCIHDNFKYFKTLNKHKVKVVGGAEWLLDNIYLIEREYKCVKKRMPLEYFKSLPYDADYLKYIKMDYCKSNKVKSDCITLSSDKLEKAYGESDKKDNKNLNNRLDRKKNSGNWEEECNDKNIPRILILAKKYINEKRELELENLVSYINYYEKIEENKKDIDYCFTMGELWAFPLMLRIAVILKLSDYTNQLVKIQKDILRGKQHAEKVIECINKGKLQEEIKVTDDNYDQEGESSLSPLFLREFTRVLRENSIEDNEIYNYSKLKWNINMDYNSFSIKANIEEESLERNISKYITDIRIIENISWRHFFEETSIVHMILKNDPAEVYNNMDFESKDYYRHKLEEISKIIRSSEVRVAMNVLELAQKSRNNNEEEYKCHVGYYLIEHGSSLLDGYYHDVTEVISQGMYVAINIGATLLISLLFLIIGAFTGIRYTLNEFILSFLLIIIPINEIVQGLINYIVSKWVKVRLVPKLDLSNGIPEKYKTVVVIPAIINRAEKVKELMEKLEVYHCGNDDPNVYFALLSDFGDCQDEFDDNDEKIIDCGIKCAEQLNKKYEQNNGGDKFFFLSRKRIYNKKMGVYMGSERKRGKLLEFMSLLRGYSNHTFDVISSPIDAISDAKYIITIDEDTFMPRETVYKLVGAMSHVLNIPYINRKNGVIRGYNIMQPKVSISMEAKNATIFSRIFGGDSGVDGYSTAYSDTYEDLFGEGTFVGKGIINIDQFYGITNAAIKKNKILSHDLLEGALTRCALITDVELVDGYPAHYEGSCRRLYRWVRGDWQLIGWLFSKKLSLLNKWKIFDNLKRSLLAPNLFLIFLISLTGLAGNSQIGIICFLVLIMPLIFTVTDFVVTPKNRLMGAFKTFKQIILIISFIPYESYLMIKAILVTLIRVIFTKRNLLEWKSAQISDESIKNDLKAYIKRMWWGPFSGILVFLISLNDQIAISLFSLIPSALWILSPYIAFYISKDILVVKEELNEEEKIYLRKLSRRIYAYYEDFVNEANNFLPPDNYQEKPFKGVAYRTSPTNIGMGLIANVTAYDFGYITMKDLIDKTYKTLESMRTLEKVHGHYLNWYDTRTKHPLYPRYISTVDNGNLLANLWILREAMEELKTAPVIRIEEVISVNDICRIIEEENPEIKIWNSKSITLEEYLNALEEILTKLNSLDEKFNTEVEYWLNKLFCEVSRKIENYHNTENDLKKINEIIHEIDEISSGMNFNFLYNDDRRLFSIGYNVEENSLGNSYYDLLASECRIASFVAVSKNDVPKSHWFNLNRAMTNAFHTHSLVSWSGTMFEYFMPSLIMKNYPKTLLDQTYKSVIKAQMSFAKQKKIPWGISESAFYEFDNDDNYQYKAFGVPGLGLKRGLEDEVVVSPYSTIICIPFCVKKGIINLKKLQGGGALGRYGFIESIDYTKAREDKFITEFIGDNNRKSVDNSVINVDNHKYVVDNVVINSNKNDEIYIVDNVNNVDNFGEKRKSRDISTALSDNKKHNNPQIDKKNQKISSRKSYPQDCEEIYNDGLKPNKIYTYMVHHLGMSIMALDNVLKDNILINRFHKIPQVKASELLLKEKIPYNVTFERNEEYSIKNRYIKGEVIIPRVFRASNDMPFNENAVLLLSNGEYSSMINTCGSGYSKKSDMMLYRWKGNSTSDDSGLLFYIKNLNSNDYWSPAFEPCKTYGENYEVQFSLDKARFSRRDGNMESSMEIYLSNEENLEVRKIILNNTGKKGRSIEVTSYCEVTLTSFEADSVHPAFSNLFIQTEYDERGKMLFGSRRGRVKGAKVPYIFQKILVDGECEGEVTYETSRINFIGRNRNLKNPKAMDNDKSLDNTVGTVLDPILSMRVRVRVPAGEKREIYFITGTSDSKEEALEIGEKYEDIYKAERIFGIYSVGVQLQLKNLELKSAQANLFQNLVSYIFYIQKGREDREEYIRNIKKHQRDLWAYGISGDLPIVFLTIENEQDINIVITMIKFYSYLKLKGIKMDLVIYNDEEVSYDEPLQKSIIQAVSMVRAENNINKPGGIYIHNKSTMSEEIKEFLIGISRIYVNSKKGTLLEQFKKCEEIQKKNDHYNVSAKEIDFVDDKENDINYNEYDHDIDFIEKSDVISGTDRPENNAVSSKDDMSQYTKHNKSEMKENHDNYLAINDNYPTEDLDFFNGYGGFDKRDNAYVIKLSNYKNTPAPWINVMSNADFGFHISESGSSYTWCGNSRENKITPWSNDYIRDPIGEALYIRDNSKGRYFSISPKPVRDSGEYIIKHGFGYSQFIHTACDIKGNMKIFAPKDERVKLQIVELENLTDEECDISIFYYAKLVLGVYGYESERYITTYTVENNNIKYIGANNPYSEYFGELHAYLTVIGANNVTISGDTKEFIGFGGEISSPKALNYKHLSGRTGSIYDPCLSVCSDIKLKPHETKEVLIVLGQDSQENIMSMINKYRNIENAHTALEKVKEYWNDFLGNIQISTPDKSMDYMLNGWLLYQTLSCRYLSRSAFYQSGGAYGFRDQLQDSMALGVVDPEITKSQIIKSASRQYIEGDVQHWWHPVVNSGIRTRFSDDLLWMPYVTAEYIKSTGEYDILDIMVPYLEDEPLREGEDERYTIVNESSKEGSIYEHCQKAIQKSLKFGEHNIPLMGSGDWNDGMSTVGNKGKGESVWLGWFLYDILNSFEEISKQRNDLESSVYYKQQREFIKENLEKYAWDGGWYRRAYFDDGTPLGSRENPECQIDSLAQSWAVISGAAKIDDLAEEQNLENSSFKLKDSDLLSANYEKNNLIRNEENNLIGNKENNLVKNEGYISSKHKRYTDRAVEAMEAVEQNLVKKDKGMILLLAPPFNNSYLEPGYIKGYVPGVRENGGQYTHAAVWVILALTKLGHGDKAVEYYNMINPINHSKTELECMVYKTEPYVMSADVYIKEPHGGRGGWSWYTGASGWMYKVGIENILGLRRIGNKGYEIKPCVPKEWNEYNIKIKNKTEDYKITVKRINSDYNKNSIVKDNRINYVEDYTESRVVKVIINGEESKNKIIPRNLGDIKVTVLFV